MQNEQTGEYEVETTIMLGIKHDGAKNTNQKVSVYTDRKNFEAGFITHPDGSYSYQMSKFLFWFLIFCDLNSEQTKDLKSLLWDNLESLQGIEFDVTLDSIKCQMGKF